MLVPFPQNPRTFFMMPRWGDTRPSCGRCSTAKCPFRQGYDAALGGHEAIVRTLLDAESRCEANRDYAIEDAAQGGHEAIVRTLLDAGAHPNAGIECAPIECAAREGHEAIVRTLLDAGADPNAGIECAPIECAAREGHEAIVRMLQDAIAETR